MYSQILFCSLLIGIGLSSAFVLELLPKQEDLGAKKTDDTFLIECSLSELEGNEAFDVKWFKVDETGSETEMVESGNPVGTWKMDKHDLRLMFNKPARSDRGTYKCVANVDGERQEQQITVSIFDVMNFVDCKAVQNPTDGEEAVIKCNVVADPTPDIVWSKDGVRIGTDNDLYTLQNGNQELVIKEYNRATDDGNYRVRASQVAVSAFESRIIKVEGWVTPAIVDWDETMQGKEGHNLKLNCRATGIPQPTISWSQAGKGPLKIGDKFDVSADGSLTINQLIPEDQVSYACTASNSVGSATATVPVSVFLKPTIKALEEMTKNRGDSVELRCEYSGDGKMTPSWIFNGQTLGIPDEDQTQETKPQTKDVYTEFVESAEGAQATLILRIHDVQLSDATEYQCHVTNDAATAVQVMELSVTHPPTIESTSNLKVRSVLDNVAVMFCTVAAEPLPTWTWWFKGSQVTADGSGDVVIETSEDGLTSTLRLLTDQEADFGEYMCNADNGVVKPATANFNVMEIRRPPTPILAAADNYPTHAEITLSNYNIIAPEETPLNVTFFYVASEDEIGDWRTETKTATLTYVDPEQGSSPSFTLSNLKPERRYQIRAETANEAGASQMSLETVNYDTAKPMPPASPVIITGDGGVCKDGQCEIRWSQPADHGSGIIAYQIQYFVVTVDNNDTVSTKSSRMSEKLPPHVHSFQFYDLQPATQYEVEVAAVNAIGQGPPEKIIFVTPGDMGFGESPSMGTGAIVVIVIVVLIIVIVLVDVSCYYVNECGVLMTICVNCCGKTPSNSKAKEYALEEGLKTDDKASEKGHSETTPMIDSENDKTVKKEATV